MADVFWSFGVAGLELYPCGRCVLEFRCGWVGVVSVWQAATRIPPQPSHTETPTHIEKREHDQCGDTIETSRTPDDERINVRNMLSIEEVK